MPNYASAKSRSYKKRYTKKPYRPLTAHSVAKIARSVTRADKPVREIRFTNDGNGGRPGPTLDTSTLANSFKVLELSNIVQGDDLNDRTGSKIYMSGVKLSITLKNFSTQSRLVRLMCVKNRNKAGDLLDVGGSWSDLFQNVDYTDRTADARILDAQSPLNRDVLEIFYDKTFQLSPTQDPKDSMQLSKYIPINRKFEYGDDGTTNVTLSGQLYFIMHVIKPDFGAGTADATDVITYARVFFKDA